MDLTQLKKILKIKEKIPKERVSVGLDIGTSAIKVVKLKTLKDDSVELCSFNLEPIKMDLGPVLKNLAQTQNINSVNISVCGPATIIRYVNFPRMNNEELRQALKFEAQKHIPFSVNEVNLDGCILKDPLPDNKMLVMLAAVKKEFLNQRLKILEDPGLKASIVDTDSAALINAFNFNHSQDADVKSKTLALLNIGASVSNLSILEEGTPRLSRDIHIAGSNFTQKIMETFGLDFKAAEETKLTPDKEREGKVSAAIESVLANLATEIRASFDYYESQSTSTVVKIYLSGGSSLFAGLKIMLSNLLGIEVESRDPLKNINIPDNIDSGKIKELSPQLCVAVGLALRL